jgi:murein DD-endopeptidase MepM/ murein hydrolase activator NlpD
MATRRRRTCDGARETPSIVRFAKIMKDPKVMTASEINRALESLSKKQSLLNQRFIDAGRGEEKAWDTLKLSDPLAREYQALASVQRALSQEIQLRAGPGTYRLPTGPKDRKFFGPRTDPYTGKRYGAKPSMPPGTTSG